MKALLIVPLCLLCLSANGQSLFRLQRFRAETDEPVRLRPRQTQQPPRRQLAPVTVHAGRDLFRDATRPYSEGPVIRPLPLTPGAAARNPLYTTEIPIAGQAVYFVSGGYFMKERAERHTETVGLFRTWPIGNEVVGIVVKSGAPER